MKKGLLIITFILYLCLLFACTPSVDSMSNDQKEALARIDPCSVYTGDFFGLTREELFNKDKDVSQEIDDLNSPAFKKLNNYYGHPAELMFLFTGAKKTGTATYVLSLDINPTNIKIYRDITSDLLLAFGSNYTMGPNPSAVQSNTSFTEQDIVNALETKQISNFYIKWKQRNTLQFNFAILKNINSIQVVFGS
ncbi:MAG: hypothetical protein WCP73_02800 [Eubacteriales bacterium]